MLRLSAFWEIEFRYGIKIGPMRSDNVLLFHLWPRLRVREKGLQRVDDPNSRVNCHVTRGDTVQPSFFLLVAIKVSAALHCAFHCCPDSGCRVRHSNAVRGDAKVFQHRWREIGVGNTPAANTPAISGIRESPYEAIDVGVKDLNVVENPPLKVGKRQ